MTRPEITAHCGSARYPDNSRPALKAALAAGADANGVSIGLLVEIKEPDAAERVAAMVTELQPRDPIVLGGFHGPALARIKGWALRLRTSLMVGSVFDVSELVALARAYHADGVRPCREARAPRTQRLLNAAAVTRLASW
jgi:glycerophosphoryl diester phosphodiesterase